MTQVIHKYTIDLDSPTPMVLHARLLQLGVQGDSVVVWALMEPDRFPVRKRSLRLVMTGYSPAEGGNYIGTVVLPAAWLPHGLVMHAFDFGYVKEEAE